MDGSNALRVLSPDDQKLAALLRALISPEHLNSLFRLLPPKGPQTPTKEDQKRLVVLLSILQAILFHFKDQQFDVLNFLAFGAEAPHLFRSLCLFVQGHPVYTSYLESNKDHISEPFKEPEFWTTFTLFISLFNHTLTTMNDDEFLRGAAFPVAEVVSFISVLKIMLNRVFRADFQVADSNILVGDVNFADFKLLLVRLGKHLHDREFDFLFSSSSSFNS
jgi:hypothetical protein